MIVSLILFCNKNLKTGEWPIKLTESIVITFPKKENLQLYQTIEQSALSAIRAKSG